MCLFDKKKDAAQCALHDGMFFVEPKFNGGALGPEKRKVVSGCCGTINGARAVLTAGIFLKSKTTRPSHPDTRLLSPKGVNPEHKSEHQHYILYINFFLKIVVFFFQVENRVEIFFFKNFLRKTFSKSTFLKILGE